MPLTPDRPKAGFRTRSRLPGRAMCGAGLALVVGFLPLAIPRCGVAVAADVAPDSGVPFDLQGFVDAALAQGSKTVTVPPGRYRVTPRNQECLGLRNLKDVEIRGDGVEMICTETTRALTIGHCTNVTVRGLSIDYDPLPFTQGRITALSADKSVHEVELSAGYPTADTATTLKYEIFRPDTRTYRAGEYGIKTLEKPDARHLRITRQSSRAEDPEQVGDLVVIGSETAPGGSIPHAVYVVGSQGVRLEGISVYASNCFAFLEESCDGTTYQRCTVDRRPPQTDPRQRADPRVRSLNADAFHSISARKGPAYIECTAQFMGDDCINICGDYHLIAGAAGCVLRVLSKQRNGIDIAAGARVELLSYSGLRLPDAQVVSVTPDSAVSAAEREFLAKQGMDAGLKEHLGQARTYRITLDREVELPLGSVIASAAHTGNGFVVRGCSFGFNRSRGILVKGSDGIIEGNTLTGNVMAAIMVAPEWWWLESGSSNNVRILNNTIRDCGDVAIAVYAFGGAPGVAPAGAHNSLRISGNQMTGCPLPNLLVTSTRGLELGANTSLGYEGKTASDWTRWAFGLRDTTLEPVMLINCDNVERPAELPR